MATTDDAFGQFELLVREFIEPNVHLLDATDGQDPAWDMMDTFPAMDVAGRTTDLAGVSSAGVAGYEASWRIRKQRGGRVTGGNIAGNTLQKIGPDNSLSIAQAADGKHLDPRNTPLGSYLPIKMLLKRLRGIITCNRDQVLYDIADNNIEETVMDTVEDATFQVRNLVTALCYSEGNGILGHAYAGATIAEGSTQWFGITEGTPFRFVVGQRYVAALDSGGTPSTTRDGSGGTAHSPGIFRCVGIDTDNRYVGFESEPGEGNIVITADDLFIVEGLYDFATPASLAFRGFEGALVSTGNFLDTAYAVTDHRELMSFVDGDEAALVMPTPEIIDAMMDKIVDSGKPTPSALIAERSLWTLYSQLERRSQAIYQVPQGAAFLASGGVSGPVLQHADKVFARLNSRQIRPGCIIGVDPKTFRRYMPLGGKTLKWRTSSGGVAGVGGIFRMVTDGYVLTDLCAAEFDWYAQIGVIDPQRCFRRIGLHSQRSSDAA